MHGSFYFILALSLAMAVFAAAQEAPSSELHATEEAPAPESEAALSEPTPGPPVPGGDPLLDLHQGLSRVLAMSRRAALPLPNGAAVPLDQPAPREEAPSLPVPLLLESVDPDARMRAIEAAVVQEDADVRPLLRHLLDPAAQVRVAAAEGVAKMLGADSAQEAWRAAHVAQVEAFEDFVYRVIVSGNRLALARLQDGLAPLRPLLEPAAKAALARADAPLWHRQGAAYLAGHWQLEDAMPDLENLVLTGDWPASLTAMHALQQFQHPRAREIWLRLVKHPHPTVRYAAVAGLGGIGDAASLKALFQIAADEQAHTLDLRLYAVDQAASWPKAQSLPALLNLMRAAPKVRGRAAANLRKLTGGELGEDPDEWAAWIAAGMPKDEDSPYRIQSLNAPGL